MEHTEGTFVGSDGQELFYQSWHPEGKRRACLILVHGFGEHSGRYSNLVNHLVPQGFTMYAFDHRGHGRSANRLLAHVDQWSEYHDDLQAFLKLVRQQTPDLPQFLMGHSMGGLVVLGYALDHPQGLQGVIASGPTVGDVDAPPFLLFIGRIMSRILPKLSLDSRLNTKAISRDPAVVAAYEQDPLVFSMATARWSTEFTKAIERTRTRAGEFRLPLLIIHGEADTLVPVNGCRSFFESVPGSDKELIIYEGGYHEPHNDIQHEQAVIDVQHWLEAHL